MRKSSQSHKEARRVRPAFLRSVLAGLAEEIRTPLDNVQSANRALLETNPTSEQRRCAERALSAADSTLNLLNDMLDYSRIGAGRLKLQNIDFDLRTTLEKAVQEMAGQAREKGLQLACLIHHEVPSLLSGDPGRVRQIVGSLTHLALQFTEKGEVLIQVTLEEETKARAIIHFAVMDTGRGIPKGERKTLFKFPHPGGRGKKGKAGTAGLSLAISKNWVERMGGRIGVESRKGQGSTIWFTAKFRKQRPENQSGWGSEENIAGKRILIVDENAAARQTLREQLRAWSCLVEEASGGKEALARLHKAASSKKPFRLAILNKEMKEVDGISLGRRVKEDPKISSTVLVLLASQGNRGDGKLVQGIGFAAYLTKPVANSLWHECLALSLSRREPFAGSGPALITRYSLAEEKKHRMRILLAEGDPETQKTARQVLQKIGYGAVTVKNGQEVLAALEQNPYDLILMGVDMAGMDGFAAARAIRRKEEGTGRHILICGMTARAEEGDRERCQDAGMDDYIEKPIRAVDLQDALGTLGPGLESGIE